MSSDNNVKESLLVCQNSQGVEIRGSIVRLSRHSVVFEVYAPALVLRTSEVLSDFRIFVSDRLIYSGRAIVGNLVQTSTALVCEATLEDGWVDIVVAPEAVGSLVPEFDQFMQEWQKSYRISPEFKMVVADMHSFLTDLRLWLEQVELGIRSSPSGDRIKLEEDVARTLGASTTPILSALFEKFEHCAQSVEAHEQAAHRAYSRRQLHPLLLCAPFLYRTFQKPLGYAGDYEMVNMIARDPHEGSSLFAKIVNLWFLRQPPAEAHRNRIVYLAERIRDTAAQAAAAGRTARIASLGCGPALEVQRFFQDSPLADRVHVTLLDFNEETLSHARTVLEQSRQKHGRKAVLEFGKKSVNQILKEAGKAGARSAQTQFDFVYCAGLFDYLTDPVCQRISNVLYEWVAPGGLFLTTNVDRSNPRRLTMDYIMEWHLIYRTGAELRNVRPQGVEECVLQTDGTGVNIYFEAKKASQ